MSLKPLCGFHHVVGADEDSAYDVLGATAPVKVSLKKAGSGRGYTRASHKAVRKAGLTTAKKALTATIAAAKSANAAHTQAERSTLLGEILIGALQNPHKALTDKQKKAVEKLKKAVDKNADAGKKAAEKGTKAAKSFNTLMSTIKKHRGAILKTALKTPKTKIAGDNTTSMGISTFDPTQTKSYSWNTPPTRISTYNPSLPAWATTVPGTSQPISTTTVTTPPISDNEAAQNAGIDTTLVADATTTDPIDHAEKAGIPTSALGKEAEKITYLHVPSDGVVYDGSQFGWPSDGFMSWNFVYGGGHGYAYTENTWKLYRGGWDNRTGYSMKEIAALSAKNGYGPIIGNPKSSGDLAWTHGLKYATEDDKFFWFPDDAPDWATAEKDREAEILKQQQEEAAAAAAEAEAAAKAQAEAQKEEDKAKQDAELAFQQEQANIATSAAQAQADIAKQQKDDEYAAQERQADLESAKAQQAADIEAQRAQAEIDKINAQNAVELARLQTQQAQAAPSGYGPSYGPSYGPGPAYADASGDGGGGGGYADDGGSYADDGGSYVGPPPFNPRDQGSVADGSASYDDPFADVPYPQEEEDAGR